MIRPQQQQPQRRRRRPKQTPLGTRRIFLAAMLPTFLVLVLATTRTVTTAFQPSSPLPQRLSVQTSAPSSTSSSTRASWLPLFSAAAPTKKDEPQGTQEKKKPPKRKRKPRYEPKWVKKQTLAESMAGDNSGSSSDVDKGIKGTIQVVFETMPKKNKSSASGTDVEKSNADNKDDSDDNEKEEATTETETKTTMALPGQPLRDVATQAGVFIQYGCGKGECGTCECREMTGTNNNDSSPRWIRPCVAVVPSMLPAGVDAYVVQTKRVKNKGLSSGKFYSVRSIVMGFWNNLLGMWGFVKYRRNAKRNWQERQEYEALIKRRTAEIRQERLAREAAEAIAQGKVVGGGGGGALSSHPLSNSGGSNGTDLSKLKA